VHFLSHVNAGLAVISTAACIVYIIKHRNNYTRIFIYKAFVTGYVAVLYVLMCFDNFIPGEYFRVAWFWQLIIPIIMVTALWGNGKNGHR